MNVAEMVREFHVTFGSPVAETPRWLNTDARHLRVALIREEYTETLAELEDQFAADPVAQIAATAKELADLVYVAYGTAIEMGVDLDAVIAATHASNMTKVGEDGKPIHRADGKVLKGPNYKPPNIRALVEKAMEPTCCLEQFAGRPVCFACAVDNEGQCRFASNSLFSVKTMDETAAMVANRMTPIAAHAVLVEDEVPDDPHTCLSPDYLGAPLCSQDASTGFPCHDAGVCLYKAGNQVKSAANAA